MLAEDADDLIARLQSMINYASEYDIYTEKVEGMESSVMFVYLTAPMAVKSEKSTYATETTEALPWYKKIFKK